MIKLEMFLDVFTLSFMFYGMLNNVYEHSTSIKVEFYLVYQIETMFSTTCYKEEVKVELYSIPIKSRT